VATIAGIISGVNAVGAAFGSPIIGRWGDKLGHRRLLIASGLAATVLYLPQAFVADPVWLVPWQLFAGFAVGGTLSTLTALLIQSSPKGREGMIIGLDSSVSALANGIGPMLGASLTASLGLQSPFILAAGIMGLGTLTVSLWVRETAGKLAP
jgi:DHA1 family multidrug resistance protein-like MFS transporter